MGSGAANRKGTTASSLQSKTRPLSLVPRQPGPQSRSSRAPAAHLPPRTCPPSPPPACPRGVSPRGPPSPCEAASVALSCGPGSGGSGGSGAAAGRCAPRLPVSAGGGKGDPAWETRPLALPGTWRAEPEVEAARGGREGPLLALGSGRRHANRAGANRLGFPAALLPGATAPAACRAGVRARQ